MTQSSYVHRETRGTRVTIEEEAENEELGSCSRDWVIRQQLNVAYNPTYAYNTLCIQTTTCNIYASKNEIKYMFGYQKHIRPYIRVCYTLTWSSEKEPYNILPNLYA